MADIVLARSGVSVVHWLASANNLAGLQWAFQWYHKHRPQSLRADIFEKCDSHQQDIFAYVVDGLLGAIEGANHGEADVITIILNEFASTIDDQQEQVAQVTAKKEFLRSSLLQRTELTTALHEQFMNFTITHPQCSPASSGGHS